MGVMDKWLNKIHNGDCLEIMRQLPDESIGQVVTSPPYNIRNTNSGCFSTTTNATWRKEVLAEGYDGHEDCMPHSDYLEWQRDCLSEMMRVLRDDGAIYYNHKWRTQDGLFQDRHDIVDGFPVRQIIIWHRKGGVNFNPHFYLPNYEVIYLIARPNFKLKPKANHVGCVWEIMQDKNNEHPAPFPLALAEQCIIGTYASIVLDPFMGSGTTAIAAKRYNRQYIGIEQSQKYCKMAEERIASQTPKLI